jgi:hypothetical protein
MEVSRRDFAWAIARAGATSAGAAFFSVWLRAAPPGATHFHSSAPREPDRFTNYRPQFFSQPKFESLTAFTEILFPTDDTPGAREAHCAPFIDFVVHSAAEYAPEMQASWREAMAWLGKSGFGTMSAPQRVSLIEAMAAPERSPQVHHDGFTTYHLIKEATVRAYYTSRAGLIDDLNYQGLAYLTAFPGCDHPDHHKV